MDVGFLWVKSKMFLILIIFVTLIAIYSIYWVLRFVVVDTLFKRDIRRKCILVVGSTTGFGHDFTIRCVQNGAFVFAGCNSPSGVELLKKESNGMSGKVFPFKLDIGSQESVDEAYKFVVSKLPVIRGKSVGIAAIVNNAGISRVGADDWLTPEDYDIVWKINTLGLIRMTQKFKKLLKVASRELEPFGIKVSIIEPSYFKTLETPLTTPEVIAGGMRRAFYQSPEDVRREYGESFIQTLASRYTDFLSSDKNSPHVEWVIDCYYHALISPFPKKRYVIGNEASYIFIPISRLTADLQDILLRLYVRLAQLPTPKNADEEINANKKVT